LGNSFPGAFQPDTAAAYLLNLQLDSAVTIKTTEKNGEIFVAITFLEDGGSASLKMIQPYGKKGIWIPQTDPDFIN
jgi:hypothetical protein